MGKKRILITGGAGFIGSALIKKLSQGENDLFVVDNLSFGTRHFISEIPDDRFFKVDILDRVTLGKVFESVDPHIVIHLAAIHFIPYCNEHPNESSQVNIMGTINVFEACRKISTIEKVLFASTAAVYPVLDGPMGERQDPAPSDIYGITKLAGEIIVRNYFLETGIPAIICRFFNAFGPCETNPHLIPVILEQIKKGDGPIRLGNLTPKRDFIHTHDMAVALEKLLDCFQNGLEVFNIGSGREYAVTEIIACFEEATGRKIEVVTDPARVRKVERMHLLANIDKLMSFINWKPEVTLSAGILDLVEKG